MISPAMFEEFFLPYMARVTRLFGHVYYGCCEPVHDRLELIKAAMPNLRSVSVSTWADFHKVDLSPWPSIQAFRARVAQRPAVQATLKAEGLAK